MPLTSMPAFAGEDERMNGVAAAAAAVALERNFLRLLMLVSSSTSSFFDEKCLIVLATVCSAVCVLLEIAVVARGASGWKHLTGGMDAAMKDNAMIAKRLVGG
mmetsp:Transcript_33841/g.81829  ORF Transcript_33841/g.81829 Transcript_33841/m.81829 type:complete len:103 (+) Transcript_33841:700-1008(+)